MSDNRLELSITGAIHNDKRLDELVSTASRTLVDLIGPSGPRVIARWSLREDSEGRTVVVLAVSDLTGGVEATFSREELENSRQMRHRLHRIWGDLLQIRSHKQLQELIGSGGSEGNPHGP